MKLLVLSVKEKLCCISDHSPESELSFAEVNTLFSVIDMARVKVCSQEVMQTQTLSFSLSFSLRALPCKPQKSLGHGVSKRHARHLLIPTVLFK